MELCEWYEEAELEGAQKSATNNNQPNKQNGKNGRKNKKRKFGENPKLWCKLCKYNDNHTTNTCEKLDPQIRAMQGQERAMKGGPPESRRYYKARQEEQKMFQQFSAWKTDNDRKEAKRRRVKSKTKKHDNYVFDQPIERAEQPFDEEKDYLDHLRNSSDYEPHSDVEYDSDSS